MGNFCGCFVICLDLLCRLHLLSRCTSCISNPTPEREENKTSPFWLKRGAFAPPAHSLALFWFSSRWCWKRVFPRGIPLHVAPCGEAHLCMWCAADSHRSYHQGALR